MGELHWCLFSKKKLGDSAALREVTSESKGLLKNSELVALSGVEAPNPERITGFDFAHPDVDSPFQQPAKKKWSCSINQGRLLYCTTG